MQSTELKKVNKPKGPSEDASITLGREKKANHREQRVGERSGGEGGKGNMIRYCVGVGRQSEAPRARRMNGNMQPWGEGRRSWTHRKQISWAGINGKRCN